MALKAWYVLTHESRSEMDADTTSALDYEHAQRLMVRTEMRIGRNAELVCQLTHAGPLVTSVHSLLDAGNTVRYEHQPGQLSKLLTDF